MTTVLTEGALLWTPTPDVIESANLTRYRHWLAQTRGLHFAGYDDLWRWSVERLDDFWASLFAYFNVRHSAAWTAPLAARAMPGARWFPGARLNYAENIFTRMTDARPPLLYQREGGPLVELSWREIYDRTARLAAALRAWDVQPGDRVVGYLPNAPAAIVALLAAASLGAVWSSCAPEFGARSVLDRFAQIEPKVLVAAAGYTYGGQRFDRRETIAALQAGLPTLARTVIVGDDRSDADGLTDAVWWDDVLAAAPTAELTFEQVPFDHPLWVLYSSGTTGLPKPIVHGHGGIVLEHLKMAVLHNDLRPGDRFFWYTSTGWMMWNYLVGALLAGATIILYDGSPAYPNMNALFALAEASGMTYFGTSAAFISACMKAGLRPNQRFDLSRIRALGSTGSPLTAEGFAWVYENVNQTLALESLSGGTDVCTAFVGGVRVKPIYAGEIQGAALGAHVQAFNERGQPVVDEVGELVITAPMPSMPLYFWNDPDMARYRSAYFDVYPGVWRHGDWIKFNQRGGCVIYGRSDSTINRQGVRIGTSELYRAVEALPEVLDSLAIDLELLGRESRLILFVALRDGAALDDSLQGRIRQALREQVSPRHVPDEIVQIEQVPYTLSGKKLEVPVRKILLGMDPGAAANPGALRNPEALDFFMAFAQQRAQ